MLRPRSKLTVADNSGAKSLYIIGIGKGSGKKFAKVGQTVTCVVRGASSTGQIKDHQVVKAIIVRTKKETGRRDGTYIRFSDNAAVICDDSGLPIGTRIFGPVAAELKEKGFNKIVSLAKEVI